MYNSLKIGLNNLHIVGIVPHKGPLSRIAMCDGDLVYQINISDSVVVILQLSSSGAEMSIDTKIFRTEHYSISWR